MLTETPSLAGSTPANNSRKGALCIEHIRTLSRLQFLKRAYCILYSEEVADNLLEASADSSNRQYESNWRAFATWLPKDATAIDRALVMSYLSKLGRTLAPRTVLVHRNALRLPLELAFNVDFDHKHFGLLAKANFRRAPPKKQLVPSWSLEEALFVLKNRRIDKTDQRSMFLKTISLTAVASANRAAELAAIERKSIALRNTNAILGVKAGFLFKNQSLEHAPSNIVIPALGDHVLCPILALDNYLELTKDSLESSLFLHPLSGKSLNAAGISFWLAKAIDWLLPESLGKGHDIRKLVTSHAWFRGIAANEIIAAGSWKSLNTFIKRYFVHGRPTGSAVVAITIC